MPKFVVLGGGHAAGQAVASLRQDGFDGEIDLIGDEPFLPYQRPPLSKQYLSGEHTIERVYLRAATFYDRTQGHAAPRRARRTHRPQRAHGDVVDRGRRCTTTSC